MQDNNKIISRGKLLALGYYQIAGGIIGICLLIWLVLSIISFNLLLSIILLSALALFLFSIYSGISLLKNTGKGLRLSLVNQILQLVTFSFAGYAYQYISGVYFSVGLDLTESFNFTFYAGISSWKLNINTDSPEYIFSFNLVAFFLLVLIIRMRTELGRKKELTKIEDIGQ